MKYKYQARIFGVFQTLVFSAVTYQSAYYTIFSDGPIYTRLGAGVFTGLVSLGVIEGIVDVVKGTHHYFGLQLWKQYAKIRGNHKSVESLDAKIENMLEYREKEHSLFRRVSKN